MATGDHRRRCPGSWKCALCLPLRLWSQHLPRSHRHRPLLRKPCSPSTSLPRYLRPLAKEGTGDDEQGQSEDSKQPGHAMDQQPGNIIVIAASAAGVQAVRHWSASFLPIWPRRCSSSSISVRTGPAFCRIFLAGPVPYRPISGSWSAHQQGRTMLRRRIFTCGCTREPFTSIGDPGRGHAPGCSPLFQSAAEAYGPRTVGIVLTGDVTRPTSQGHQGDGGRIIVQQPYEADTPSMPLSALRDDHPDYSPP